MKNLFKILDLILGVLFIAGAIFYIVFVNALPLDVYNNLSTHHILLSSYGLLAVGILSFIISQLMKGYVQKEIVYVDQITKVRTKDENSGTDTIGANSSDAILLNEIEAISKSTYSESEKAEKILFYLSGKIKAGQGIIYKTMAAQGKSILQGIATYAYSKDKNDDLRFEFGEGLAGMAAKENKFMLIDNIPQGYIKVFSGLGNSSPAYLLILPLVAEEKVAGILELALFEKPNMISNVFFKELSARLGSLLVSA